MQPRVLEDVPMKDNELVEFHHHLEELEIYSSHSTHEGVVGLRTTVVISSSFVVPEAGSA